MSPNTDRLCFVSCAYQRRTNFALSLMLTRDLLPLGLSIYCPLQLVDLAFFSILEPQIQPAILQSCMREIKSVIFFSHGTLRCFPGPFLKHVMPTLHLKCFPGPPLVWRFLDYLSSEVFSWSTLDVKVPWLPVSYTHLTLPTTAEV